MGEVWPPADNWLLMRMGAPDGQDPRQEPHVSPRRSPVLKETELARCDSAAHERSPVVPLVIDNEPSGITMISHRSLDPERPKGTWRGCLICRWTKMRSVLSMRRTRH
jgi:hypothetical protein